VAAYKAAYQWKDFTTIVEFDINKYTTEPEINLKGNASIEIAKGSTYTDAGATAWDYVDGDITSKIIVGGTVDTKTAGTYTLTYNVTDTAGNKAAEVKRTVLVIGKTTIENNELTSISLYPVPLKDLLSLSLGGEVASLVQVIDARGVVVVEQAGILSGEIQLKTSALAAGFYTLRVVTACGIVLRQVVK
jgi:hypothetical protein